MKENRFPIKIDTIENIKNDYFEVVAGDYLTNILDFEVTQRGIPYDLSGLVVEIDFLKSDRKLNEQDMNTGIEIVDEVNGKVSCLLAPNSINVEGRIRGEIKILEGIKLLTSMRFEFFVRNPLVTDHVVESTTELPILMKLIAKADDLVKEQIEMVEAEGAREGNEQLRITLHSELLGLKSTLESLKITLEDTNTDVEDNENNRIINENARIDNEVLRETLYNNLLQLEVDLVDLNNTTISLIGDTSTAITNTNIATDNANSAATNANNVSDAITQAEGLRVTAESLRVTAEGLRVTAENARKTAEQARESNYTTKINEFIAETERVEAIYPTRLTKVENDLTAHKKDYASLFITNVDAKNSIYRGKHLGGVVTAEQYTAISSGTFADLYIGDYWTIGGVYWRIAAFNYYRNTGDTLVPSNHITIVPDTQLYTHVMNDTHTTTGGYTGSKMYTVGLEQAKTTIRGIFGTHLVKHRQLHSNATVGGKASGWAWVDSEVDLMSEIMVYGSTVWGESTIGGTGYNIGVGKSQLPLFALNPRMINRIQSYWLRDVVSASDFADVSYFGIASCRGASLACGVRPAFSIS